MLNDCINTCRYVLGATGIGTMVMGVTAPTGNDIWPKVVAIMGGLVATMFSVMFGTFIKHIYSHTEKTEELIDNKLNTQSRICTAELKNSIRDAIVEGIKEGVQQSHLNKE